MDAWFFRPVWILLLAFLVLGPFALPLVWLSPRMGLAAKVIVSVILIVYTALLMYYTYALVTLTLRQFSSIIEIQGLL